MIDDHYHQHHLQLQLLTLLSMFPLGKITLLLLFFFFIVTSSLTHKCPPTDETSSSSNNTTSCPLHLSSFPFSSSPGCGHPWFQITHCSLSTSIISINNFSFSILHYQPNSTFLLLSPQTPSIINSKSHSQCSSPFSFPNNNNNNNPSSINLSGSPFRFSDSSCSRLSVLKPCPPLTLPNCSLCSWECDLLKRPIHLLQGCQPKPHQLSEQGCQEDFFGFLQGFLKWGIQIEWDENHDSYFTSCKLCQANNGVCGFNSSDPTKPFLCFSSKTHFSKPKIRHRIVLFCALFISACIVLVIATAMAIFRFFRGGPKSSTEVVEEEDPATLFLHRHRSANLLPPVFSYEELESSTNKFDPKRKIGDGGFGSVFLGQLFDGRLVAVKKLHRPATKSFCNEILILSSIEHPNLVKLHGYCSDPRGLLLVYDYIPNGTLADHLHGSKSSYRKGSLTWQVRVEIALQTAMALEYLHFSVEPAIVHRDITSSNIFVEKDLKIKVGDFGLCRLLVYPESSMSARYVWTGPQGTPGYLDPDYHRSFRLTEKSDVYSLGVILLELISGMKAVDLTRDKREMALADLVVSKIQMGCLHQVVDPVLIREGEAMDTIDAVAELAFRCVANEKDDRPDTKEIVTELKLIRNRVSGHRGSKVAALG